jgi:hypothetical protein
LPAARVIAAALQIEVTLPKMPNRIATVDNHPLAGTLPQ